MARLPWDILGINLIRRDICHRIQSHYGPTDVFLSLYLGIQEPLRTCPQKWNQGSPKSLGNCYTWHAEPSCEAPSDQIKKVFGDGAESGQAKLKVGCSRPVGCSPPCAFSCCRGHLHSSQAIQGWVPSGFCVKYICDHPRPWERSWLPEDKYTQIVCVLFTQTMENPHMLYTLIVPIAHDFPIPTSISLWDFPVLRHLSRSMACNSTRRVLVDDSERGAGV